MTLGIFLPAMLALSCIFELLIVARLKGKLPSRMDADYQGEETEKRRRAFSIVMVAAVLTPILAYIILNLVSPETGAMVLF